MKTKKTRHIKPAEWRRREEICKQMWFDFIESHNLPEDIPVRPDLVYANEGWNGWQHWMGWRVLQRVIHKC